MSGKCSICCRREESKYIRSCYPRLKALIEGLPLYETFFVAGQEFLVTHSWLVDNLERGIGEKDFDINVDCCAFYSPLRGGNLEAYRCEDGTEFYAYEEEQFYKLVDEFIEKKPLGEVDITKEQWYVAVLFRNQYLRVMNQKEIQVPHFENEKAKWAYEKMREKFAHCSINDLLFEAEYYMGRIKVQLRMIMPKYWLLCREQGGQG